jgi:lipopolysaccharide transport system permease protein
VFTFVFSRVARLKAPGDVPYGLFVMAAMLPWQFFSSALTESSNSLIGNANLISKVYFPRLIVPAGSVITSFVDFLITLGLTAGLMIWYRFAPGAELLVLPLFMLLTFGASFGAGLWLSALNVEYRDFRYIVPFIVQFGLYVSPVGFSSNIVPDRFRVLYSLNPMVGVIDGFRWSMLRGQWQMVNSNSPIGISQALDWSVILLSCGIVVLLCASGIWYFRRMERTFADVI